MAVLITLAAIYTIQFILAALEYLFDGGGLKRFIMHANPILIIIALTHAYKETRNHNVRQ